MLYVLDNFGWSNDSKSESTKTLPQSTINVNSVSVKSRGIRLSAISVK